MNFKKIFTLLFSLVLLCTAAAQEEANISENQNIELIVLNDTENAASNETQQAQEIEEIIFKNFIPKEFKLGDAQFSIQIQNNKNEAVKNVLAYVSGKGFSTYDVTPVDTLESGEKGYILVNGNFKESGLINLTIKIDQKTFYQEINILGESEDDIKKAEVLVRQQEEKKRQLKDLSSNLEILKSNYSDLEKQLAQKEDEGYNIKDINLEDLKKNIRDAQAGILGEHVEEARVDIGLTGEELSSIENKMMNLKKLSAIKRFKENIILFSSIAGAIITFFALYELLKKKSKEATTRIETIKQKAVKKEEPKNQEQDNQGKSAEKQEK